MKTFYKIAGALILVFVVVTSLYTSTHLVGLDVSQTKYILLEPTFSIGEIPESYFASASFLYTLLFTMLIFSTSFYASRRCVVVYLKTLAKNETNNTERK